MLSQLRSMSVFGVEAYEVEVEVDISGGIPGVTIVGLPDKAISEARERVRSAIRNAGFDFPSRRITVNLAPAHIRKEGPSFDLPIALGILAASEQIGSDMLRDFIIVGELSLDGRVRQINGVLSMALEVRKMKSACLMLPRLNLREALLARDLKVFPVNTLGDAVDLLTRSCCDGGSQGLPEAAESSTESHEIDFSEVKGQSVAKRAFQIAAAGHHNMLMIGPPGSGKTMLARRISTILPSMTFEESLEVTKLYSVQGLLPSEKPLVVERPFRAPHHSASYAGLVGGGSPPRPGEISLAHHGVLFLDELPEFRHNVLEMLRQPMEDRKIVISRSHAAVSYPTSFMLVAAMNPCPCGYYGDSRKACECSYLHMKRYMARLSGPLLDRIDIHIEVPRLKNDELLRSSEAGNSQTMKDRVEKAREIQKERYQSSGLKWNVHMTTKDLSRHCALTRDCLDLLRQALEKMHLSSRAYTRILKLARTIADLDGRSRIEAADIAEALQYRNLDRESL
ncbi:MAG: YifB family Mg chelatase-like AAA ATPase [Vulcanimicrobiota bacterium]